VSANATHRLWFARLLIALVIAWNLQAALAFLLHPADHAAGLGLPVKAGTAMVAGMGLLFLMWNVPYVVALRHPKRHRISLFEAIAMQTIGLIGESVILLRLVPDLTALHATITRFVFFDLAGLVLLTLAALLTKND